MNVGIHSGLIDAKHEKSMGSAVWLYLWLVWRQTKSNGLVLGGMPLTYDEIATRSGWAARTVRMWLDVLRAGGYVEVTYTAYKKLRIRVLKPKKFHFAQLPLTLTENRQSGGVEPLTESCQSVRRETVNHVTGNCQSNKSGSRRGSKEVEPKAATQPVALVVASPPKGVSLQTWRAFVEMRATMRRPLTPGSVDLLLEKLAGLAATGNDPQLVVEQSIRSGWNDLFELRENRNGTNLSKHEARQARTLAVAKKALSDDF